MNLIPEDPWRLGLVEELINGADGKTRGAKVRVVSKTGRPSVLRRPIQHLYPLKVNEAPENDDNHMMGEDENGQNSVVSVCRHRPNRAAAIRARDQTATWISDSQIYYHVLCVCIDN